MTALEDAKAVLALIERAGPVDCDQIRAGLAWDWRRYNAAMRKIKYYDLAYCDHDDGKRWKLGQERVVRVRRQVKEHGMVIDPGTNRGQYEDKDGKPLTAHELSKRLGR